MTSSLVISVVLNTNHREDTLQCLASLNRSTYKNHKIILLDNASSDGSIEAVRTLWPEVQIIKLQKNLGYAGNNNLGIQAAMEQGANWVFILNEDTILDPECIRHLVLVSESDQTFGIAGPMVYHHDEPNVIQSAGGRIDKYYRGWHLGQNELDQGQFEQPHPVDWISGCGMMVRRSLIEQLGAIDERFFYYMEEFDWCIRAKKAGWQIIHVPQAKLWHKGVQSDYQPKPSITYYATRNQLLVLLKHHASLMAWIITLVQLFRTFISWSLKPKYRYKNEHRNAMWRGFLDFFHHRWGKISSY